MELNYEQTRLIEAEPSGPMQIKGVAGSGKTTVALLRTLFLHQNYCPQPDDQILLATYNKTLINYLKYIHKKMDNKHRHQYANIFSDEEERVDIKTVDSIIYQHYQSIEKDNKLEILYASEKSRNLLRNCISELQKDYQDISIIDQNHNRFLMDEIDWIKSCNYCNLTEYQEVDRIGRARMEDVNIPQRLAKNSKGRQAIFELMQRYDRHLAEKGYIYHKNMALEVYKYAQSNPCKTYKHIIIDEGQDLTRVQLEYLKTLYRGDIDSSFNFIADTAQSIYAHAWLVRGRSFASVGFDMSGKGNILSKNYRTSTQAAQAAYSLIEKDKHIVECEDYVPPALLDQQGQYPVLKSFATEREETESVLNSVKELLRLGYQYNDIVIIARMKMQLECVESAFIEAGLPCKALTTSNATFKKKRIQMMTMHAIKGLEYKVVFIIGLNQDVIPYISGQDKDSRALQESNERKLLYVGMTRARSQLFLSYHGNPSKFINEINPKFLRSGSGSKIKSYNKINVDDYIFKNKIRQLYSKEEEVRQWVIRELIDTYRYPDKLIELERKVSLFSKKGSVDIAVNVYQNNLHLFSPFIFIETKAPGANMEDAMEQLKSYMKVSNTCQYGILTDGSIFLVINNQFEPVDDIPTFHQSMLPAGGDIYTYKDIINKKQYTLKVDYEAPNRVIVIKEDEQQEYNEDNAQQVPIYHRVAAGDSQLMDESVEGYFCLPSQWFKAKKDIFVLKVKGDSMVDAEIEDGDLVVVEKRDDAKNRDIVIVALGDEGVIKRYSPMGDTVLLLSENELYEPIHVKTEQARILGKALSIIKGR